MRVKSAAGPQLSTIKVNGAAPEREIVWSLRGRTDESSPVQSIDISTTTFRVGRGSGTSLVLSNKTVSSVHAEITTDGDSIWLRDLQSTNGTYVNGKPLKHQKRLREGDIIHFASVGFRLSREVRAGGCRTQLGLAGMDDRVVSMVQFDRLMNERAVVAHFQPIVSLPDRQTVGFEVLGRGRIFGLQTPTDMFQAASQLNLEEELSRMLRHTGIEKAAKKTNSARLFVNTHPAEIVTSGLLDSLRQIRERQPDQAVTLEVHEAAITDAGTMRELRETLTDLHMQLAYDDFGSGQSRLAELVPVSPDIVKFDMSLVRHIHLAPPKQQQMLANLVQLVRELGITPLAEGVELPEEHDVCCQIGFALAQGYFYGRPTSKMDVA